MDIHIESQILQKIQWTIANKSKLRSAVKYLRLIWLTFICKCSVRLASFILDQTMKIFSSSFLLLFSFLFFIVEGQTSVSFRQLTKKLWIFSNVFDNVSKNLVCWKWAKNEWLSKDLAQSWFSDCRTCFFFFFFGNTEQSFCVAVRGMSGNNVARWILSDPDED